MTTAYVITNHVNRHQYVGITIFTPKERLTQHIYKATKAAILVQSYLYNAMRKYGVENFTIEAVAGCQDRKHASAMEQAIIKRLKPVYNMTNGGEATEGRYVTDEARERMRQRALRRKFTPEQNKANSDRKKEQWATRPELREITLASLAKSRENIDIAARNEAVGKSARERVWTDESRAALSESCMGRVYGQDVNNKILLTKSKPVTCEDLDMTFGCIEEAAIRLDLSVNSLYKVCGSGRTGKVGGLTFYYETDIAKCEDARRSVL